MKILSANFRIARFLAGVSHEPRFSWAGNHHCKSATPAFRGAGVSPAFWRAGRATQTRRRDASATKPPLELLFQGGIATGRILRLKFALAAASCVAALLLAGCAV